MSEEHSCPMCAAGHPCVTPDTVRLPAVRLDGERPGNVSLKFSRKTLDKFKEMGIDLEDAAKREPITISSVPVSHECPKCKSSHQPKVVSGMGLRTTCRDCGYVCGYHQFKKD